MCGTFFLGTPGISFRAFDLSGKINDPYVDGGLNVKKIILLKYTKSISRGGVRANVFFKMI